MNHIYAVVVSRRKLAYQLMPALLTLFLESESLRTNFVRKSRKVYHLQYISILHRCMKTQKETHRHTLDVS